MDNVKKILLHWLDDLEGFNFPKYEEFPDIELYMEQVINYLSKELNVFQTTSDDKVITHSMINNYVKGNVVTAPIQKKYNSEHLALINETCTLKQVLSISEIKQILDSEYQGSNQEAFNSFAEKSDDEFHTIAEDTKNMLKDVSDNDVKQMTNIALDLSIKAAAYSTIAKRILYYNKLYTDMQEINSELEENKKATLFD